MSQLNAVSNYGTSTSTAEKLQKLVSAQAPTVSHVTLLLQLPTLRSKLPTDTVNQVDAGHPLVSTSTVLVQVLISSTTSNALVLGTW
jgi:hypothetical protein